MKKISISDSIIIIVFAVMIVLPLLYIQWTGGGYSEREKRFLADAPVFVEEDGTVNLDAGEEVKSWLGDHIGFREAFVKLSSAIRFYIFGQSPSDKVHIGDGGWLYYTQDENLQIATGEYTLTDEILEQTLAVHLANRDKLASMGIEYVIILPTSKVSIYPEYLRYGSEHVKKTAADIVADYLEEHSDLRVIRLKQAVLTAKEEQQIYYKTDTHWNQYGAYAGYKEVISRLNEWGLCDSSPVEVIFEEGEFLGEFGDMMGIDLPAEKTLNSVIQEPKAIENGSPEKFERFQTILEQEGILTVSHYFENPSVDGPSVMLYGGSMFAHWNMAPLMAENFSCYTYVWDRTIRDNLLEEFSPDIVIYEIAERYLNTMPYVNVSFLETTLEDYDASILSYEWDKDELSVTVQNVSGSVWQYANQIKLGIFSEGEDTHLRAYLPALESVEPGDTVRFVFSFGEYPDLLSKDIQAQMLQEGICYFGQKEQVWSGIP